MIYIVKTKYKNTYCSKINPTFNFLLMNHILHKQMNHFLLGLDVIVESRKINKNK